MERHETPQDRYHKAHTVSLTIRLMKNTEQDIIQKLDSVPNKAGYIKALIRADIGENSQALVTLGKRKGPSAGRA